VDSGVGNFTTSFDANGNPVSIREVNARPGAYGGNRDLGYDGLDRLIYAHLHDQQVDRWHYDALDRLAHHDHGKTAADGRQTYYYDARNQLSNVVNVSSGASVAGLSWDAQGNLSNNNGQRYIFDTGNRLREVVGKAWYRYDGLGRRVLSAAPDGIAVYQYSHAGQLLYYEQNGQRNEQIYLAGRLLASRRDGITTYLHTDALGSPIAETNAAGQLTQRIDYGPFGDVLRPNAYSRIGYTGHLHDGATGLLQMQQRYFDPALHTFLSVDPVGAFASNDSRQFNRYVYAANNPYRYRDPDGQWICSVGGPSCAAFEAGLEYARSLINSPSLNMSERVMLIQATDFYGQKGDPAVEISFASLGAEAGNASASRAIFDLERSSRVAWGGKTAEENSMQALAKFIVHEGDHGQRWLSGEAAKISRFNLEIKGYQTQATFQKAANFFDFGASQNGWSPIRGYDDGTIRSQAAFSTIVACKTMTGCDGTQK
jgi:RHS repeat-associated protein